MRTSRRFARLLLRLAAQTAAASLILLPRFAGAQTPPPPPPPPPPDAGGEQAPTPTNPAPAGGGRYLLLPDISLIGTFRGHLSNDKRDANRERLRLDEGEIGIQSYVYPSIRADAFIVFGDGEATMEEGFLSIEHLGLGKLPLSATVGRRKVPFGRVNQLHPHSWNYVVQPYVLTNLFDTESLTGDGAYLSYLFPTGKRLFVQLDAGFWSRSESLGVLDPGVDPSEGVVDSPGAGIADKFTTLRLWSAAAALGGDLEIGGSLARGKGAEYTVPGGTATDAAARAFTPGRTIAPTIQLSGLDLTYRRAGARSARLLIRSEYVRHEQKDGGESQSTDGYYVFADQRFNQFDSLGIRYDRSGYPYAPGLHEQAVSLIGTHALTEQTYLRLQLIHGDRPDKKGFNEMWFQWVWGVGPHTHNLE